MPRTSRTRAALSRFRDAATRRRAFRQELPGQPGVAELVRALPEEAGPAASHVQAGAHPVARSRVRPAPARRSTSGSLPEARECVGDELPFEHAAGVRVRDMRRTPSRRTPDRLRRHAGPADAMLDSNDVCVTDPAADGCDIRARTRSPGMAPATNTTCPVVARDHPPAGRGFLDFERQRPARGRPRQASNLSVGRPAATRTSRATRGTQRRQRTRPWACARETATSSATASLSHSCTRSRVRRSPRERDQFVVQVGQPLQQGAPRRSPACFASRAKHVEATHGRLQRIVPRAISSGGGAQCREPLHDPLDVRGQALAGVPACPSCDLPGRSLPRGTPEGSSPGVERLEHVRFAEA